MVFTTRDRERSYSVQTSRTVIRPSVSLLFDCVICSAGFWFSDSAHEISLPIGHLNFGLRFSRDHLVGGANGAIRPF